MFLAKIRTLVFLCAAVATLGLGAGVFAYRNPGKEEEKPLPPPRPVAAPLPVAETQGPPVEEKPVTFRTTNFEIHAPSRRIAQLIGAEAERQRKTLAVRWLGEEMPDWKTPCPLKVTLSNNGAGGATTFAFDHGRILSREMDIEGSLDRLLTSVLPHEITHTVLAYSFRRSIPLWADEGAAVFK